MIRGTTFPAGKIIAPGVVQWDVKGDTTLGPFEPKPAPFAEVERLADACTRGGMPTQAVADARGPQWRKVIFNAATNPLGALTGLTHGRVCERPDAARARLAARRRGQGGRGRAGDRARLRPGGADRLRRAARGRLRPQGVDAPGRRGAPADRGRLPERRHRRVRQRYGVPTPAHEAIWALVKGVEASWSSSGRAHRCRRRGRAPLRARSARRWRATASTR